MEKTETSISNNPGEIPMVGDHLALDLLNTEMRVGNESVDLWRSGEDVHAWLERCGLVASVSIAAAEKQRLLVQARELRTLARQLIEQWKNGQMGDVQPLNKFLDAYLSAPQVTSDDTGKLSLTRVAKADPVANLLGPVAEAVAQLLTDGELELVKKCAHPECILWFYDRTKSHKRRWCSMASCGNRHKAAQFRKKVGTT
ncbi:ABATE domain-containing protein [Limnobacter sp.]|uniref:CGNR zinc finger domain-containing protein n=1 Tax=Limnobacter sp. TaxID=2003368 RepID=UPI0027BA2CD3|nr:ABATE domain-containing protein [Limnobacter sp.]